MCNYQTLFHDDNTGYVVRCRECEKIQVGFGNLMLTVNTLEFDSFRRWIHQIKEEQIAGQPQTVRNIVIPTPCEGMKLLLSARELDGLDIMLEEADTELKAVTFLNLFSNP